MKQFIKRLTIVFGLFSSLMSFGQDHDYKIFKKNTAQGTKSGIQSKSSGKEIIPARYDEILGYSNGRFFVKDKGGVGVIDTTGKVILSLIYEEIGYLEDRAFVKKQGKWAMYNYQNGSAMTAFGYQDGVARVVQKGKTGYVDKFGKIILGCKFEEGYDCWGDFILVYEKSFISTGYEYVTKNRQGEVINKQDIGYSGKKPIVFNKKGQIVYVGEQYEKVSYNDGKYTFVVKNGDGGEKLLDINGDVVVPFSKGYSFSSTLNWILIKSYQGYGILDFKGKELLTPSFESITGLEFGNGTLAKVYFKNGEYFYIDNTGKCVETNGIKCPE